MNPTPVQHRLHELTWSLTRLHQELKKKQTPITYPTLINIKRGYKLINGKKKKYSPSLRTTLADIGKVLKIKPEQVYEDRSSE